MVQITVTLNLSEETARQAEQAGLLNEAGLTPLIEAALNRQKAGDRLLQIMEELQAASDPMSEEEVRQLVNAEIEAYRREKRALEQPQLP